MMFRYCSTGRFSPVGGIVLCVNSSRSRVRAGAPRVHEVVAGQLRRLVPTAEVGHVTAGAARLIGRASGRRLVGGEDGGCGGCPATSAIPSASGERRRARPAQSSGRLIVRFSWGKQPAPQVAVRRLFAVKLHVEPPFFEVGDLQRGEIERAGDGPGRRLRALGDRQVDDHRTAHASSRALVQLRVVAGPRSPSNVP